jgi:hydroxycarboxylate dehydrogenase B
MPRIQYDALRDLAGRLFRAGGMPERDSALLADLLAKADLRGYTGHGTCRVGPYLAWIKDGTTQIADPPAVLRESKTTAVVDAKHYIGQVAAYDAMKFAIAKAKEHGTGTVALRRAGHVGRLADYMELAADEGMIGFGAVCVGSGSVTLYGGMERITGTNPMAYGIPARGGRHVILDFATSSMSMGEIQKREGRGEPIREGAMLDGYGKPTNSVKTFRGPPRGVLLPFGGYKGSGLNVVTEILAGILTGSGSGRAWWDKGGHGVNGVLLQAIAVEEFLPLEEFLTGVDEFAARAKKVKPAPGFDEVLLPGERARKIEERQMRDGVELDEPTWEALLKVADDLRVSNVPKPL